MNYDLRVKKYKNVIARSVVTWQSSLGHNQAWKILKQVQDDRSHNPSLLTPNQSGFANLAMVLLLVASIGVGTYLVQQQTDFLPKAAENLDQGNCRDNPVDPPSVEQFVNMEQYRKDGATWRYKWEASCSKSCNVNSDCPQNTNNEAVSKASSNWCYQFKDGNRCLMLTTTDKPKADSSSSTTKKDDRNLTNDQRACLETTTNQYYDIKVGTRLSQYYMIVREGKPNMCVKADLGLEPPLKAKPKGGTTEERLFLCSGRTSTKNKLDLTWRVDASDAGTNLRDISDEDKKKFSLDPNNLPNKEHVKKAEEMANKQ